MAVGVWLGLLSLLIFSYGGYRKGMGWLIDLLRSAGVRVCVMMPPPFDSASSADPLLPPGTTGYNFVTAYRDYDAEVLGRYAERKLSLVPKG